MHHDVHTVHHDVHAVHHDKQCIQCVRKTSVLCLRNVKLPASAHHPSPHCAVQIELTLPSTRKACEVFLAPPSNCAQHIREQCVVLTSEDTNFSGAEGVSTQSTSVGLNPCRACLGIKFQLAKTFCELSLRHFISKWIKEHSNDDMKIVRISSSETTSFPIFENASLT